MRPCWTIVAERLPIALRLLGYARLRVDANVVEALTHEVEAAGYPLLDIDTLLYEHLAQAIREAGPRRPWFTTVRHGRLIVAAESQEDFGTCRAHVTVCAAERPICMRKGRPIPEKPKSEVSAAALPPIMTYMSKGLTT